MRYTILLTLGLMLSGPAESSASCFGRCWGSRCSGCYGYSYGGCWGSCYGSCWGSHSYGCAGCYGGYHGGYGYARPAWNGYVSTYYAGGYYNGALNQSRYAVPATRTSNYYEADRSLSHKVKVEVVVADPAGSIKIEGVTTSSTGTQRSYESPVLEAGKPYYYTIAYQSRDGASRETRTIVVQAGEQVLVDFTRPAAVGSTTEVRETLTMPESKLKRNDAALPK